MKIYNEKEQAEQEKEVQNVQLGEKRAPERGMELSPGFIRNEGSGDLSARSHPAKFPTCEKK